MNKKYESYCLGFLCFLLLNTITAMWVSSYNITLTLDQIGIIMVLTTTVGVLATLADITLGDR